MLYIILNLSILIPGATAVCMCIGIPIALIVDAMCMGEGGVCV